MAQPATLAASALPDTPAPPKGNDWDLDSFFSQSEQNATGEVTPPKGMIGSIKNLLSSGGKKKSKKRRLSHSDTDLAALVKKDEFTAGDLRDSFGGIQKMFQTLIQKQNDLNQKQGDVMQTVKSLEPRMDKLSEISADLSNRVVALEQAEKKYELFQKEMKESVVSLANAIGSVNHQLQKVKQDMWTEDKLKAAVQEEFAAVVGQLQAEIEDDIRMKHEHHVKRETQLREDLERMKTELNVVLEEFPAKTTLVCPNFPFDPREDEQYLCNLFEDLLMRMEARVNIVRIARFGKEPTEERPGIIKIQLQNHDEKAEVLSKKRLIRDIDDEFLSTLVLQVSESHSEKAWKSSVKTLLRYSGFQDSLYMLESGKLVPRRGDFYNHQPPATPSDTEASFQDIYDQSTPTAHGPNPSSFPAPMGPRRFHPPQRGGSYRGRRGPRRQGSRGGIDRRSYSAAVQRPPPSQQQQRRTSERQQALNAIRGRYSGTRVRLPTPPAPAPTSVPAPASASAAAEKMDTIPGSGDVASLLDRISYTS